MVVDDTMDTKTFNMTPPTPRSPSGSVVGPGSFVGLPKASEFDGRDNAVKTGPGPIGVINGVKRGP